MFKMFVNYFQTSLSYHFVANPKEKELDRTKNDSSRPENTYMAHAHLRGQYHWQQMPRGFLPTILRSMLSHHHSHASPLTHHSILHYVFLTMS